MNVFGFHNYCAHHFALTQISPSIHPLWLLLVHRTVLDVDKNYIIIHSLGELDPERIGSGIQYGDTTTRRLHRENNRRQPDCFCRM
jgi:hypothetical protein